LVNWRHEADAGFAAGRQTLEAHGILCAGFVLWREVR
jgi:hypothetical protein